MFKFASLFVLVGVLSGAAFSQDKTPDPGARNKLFSSDLIVWTGVNQPLTELAAIDVPPAIRFFGRVVREQNLYFLQTSETGYYQLDRPEIAQPLEGKWVSMRGALDASGTRIHIEAVE